jgi:UDPglucose 6-dehydrogenase
VGEELAFLVEIDAINSRRRSRSVEVISQALGGRLQGRKIAVLGAAFKPNSDDVRDSPALAVSSALHRAGADVWVHDPQAVSNARRACPDLTYADSIQAAILDADVVCHLTEWAEYSALEPMQIRELVRTPVLFDGRNSLDIEAWHQAGWSILSLGRPAQLQVSTQGAPSQPLANLSEV